MKKKVITSILILSLSVICVSPVFAATPSNNMDFHTKEYGSYSSAELQPSETTVTSSKNIFGYINMSECSVDDYTTVETIVTPLDANTFQVSEPDGTVIGTYSIFPDPAVSSRATWRLNWRANPGTIAMGDDSISSYSGLRFTYNITGVPGGASQLGFYSYELKRFYPMASTSKGQFMGTFSLNANYGHISLAIKNVSQNIMVYSGVYSI